MTTTTSPRLRLAKTALGIPLIVGALLIVSACGDATTPRTTGSSSATPTDQPGVAGGGGNAGGDPAGGGAEAPGTLFQSSRFHYQITSPGTMQEAADGTATGARGDERLTVRVVTGAAAANPSSVAQADLTQARSSAPDFTVVQNPMTATLPSGQSVLKDVTTATDGTNPLTGKLEQRVTVRYYFARNASTLAVVTYSTTPSQYDPQGADDIASTFRWQ